MDEKDLELLRILEDNSRLSAQEIGVMTCLSPAEAEARIHALEAAGIIRKYTTVINWEMAGNGGVSSIIDLKVSRSATTVMTDSRAAFPVQAGEIVAPHDRYI
jgi:DNA-binding Lrp family transcriptional regulator